MLSRTTYALPIKIRDMEFKNPKELIGKLNTEIYSVEIFKNCRGITSVWLQAKWWGCFFNGNLKKSNGVGVVLEMKPA